MSQKTSQQLAIDAEKIFNNDSLLLITFHEQELNKSVIKQLHSDIKNVHILHPIFIPKRRCIIEIEKKSDINLIKSTLSKKQFDTGYITVDFIKNYKETNKNIDPYTLYVRNLPANITSRDIEMLFPTCMKYKFLSSLENSKSLLVRFHTTEDAIIAYKSTNNIFYQSNLLIVQFNRKRLKANPLSSDQETVEEDEEFDDELKEDDVDNDSSDENAYIDDDFTNNDDYNYNMFEQGASNRNATSRKQYVDSISRKNNSLTDTIHVENLPMNITDDELLDLYPNCHEYRFLTTKSRTKSVLLRFQSAKDATTAYNDTNNTVYNSHTLYVEYYCKTNDPSVNEEPEVINLDVSDDENDCSIVDDEATVNEEINGSENNSQKNSNVSIINNIQVRTGKATENEHLKKPDTVNEDNIDPYVLHIQNLPLAINSDDLVKLYPACREYQILREKPETTVSALIYFNSVHEAKEAHNNTSNIIFKSKVLSVKFRCKNLIINPLAVMKRKTNHLNDSRDFNTKKMKNGCDNRRSNSSDDDDIILVSQAQKVSQSEEMKEDDVEYKSEDEEYVDDFGVDPELDNDDYEEDAIEDDEDQDMELDENDTFLPHDEDD